MKRGIFIALVLFLLVFAVACDRLKSPQLQEIAIPSKEPTEPEAEELPLCNKPYFEFKKSFCCLDSNNNKICDSDEKKQELPRYPTTSTVSQTEISRIVAKLQNSGLDVIDLAPAYDSINGDIMVLWLNAPGSEADFNQVKTAFTEMYNMWGKNYNVYFIHVDNAKNRNPYRKHEICTFGADRIYLKNAITSKNWDTILFERYCW